MGLETEFHFDKKCSVNLSPKTVLPSLQHCSNIDKRCRKERTARQDEILTVKEGFTEISFRHYRSASCKSIPSRPVGVEGNLDLKRGSIYQSSKEVREMKKMGTIEGRKKVETLRSSDASFSSRIVDSLCRSNEESLQERTPVLSVGSNLISTSDRKTYSGQCSSDGFIEICLSSDVRERGSTKTARRETTENMKFGSEPVVGPLDDGNDLEKNNVHKLQKSLSVKVKVPHSPSLSESDRLSRTSSRTRFSPIRKMFDPFMKSKSLRSPLGYATEGVNEKTIGMENMRRNKTFQKSLLHDFSHTAQNSELNTQFIQKDSHHSALVTSPVHLHGCLKLGNKHGVNFFEFSMDQPEDVFVAKTWKAENAFNWIYTFHSVGSRKKSNASIWGSNDSSKESSIVGQMQVSCYLCSDIKDGGFFDNSVVTEFVLYDIAHARQHVSVQKSHNVCKLPTVSSPGLVVGGCESDDGSDPLKVKDLSKFSSDNFDFDSSNESYPRASADLHPSLEIAAIVIQVPLEKRESLKYRRGYKNGDNRHLNLLNLSIIEESKEDVNDSRIQEKVKVVVPTGNHGLPSAKSKGPSSLLERWRLGGGCDCGGWDMACPLAVFGNPSIKCTGDQQLVTSQQPFEIFVQGGKESAPALTMTAVKEGEYAVDFHAKLSALQAFCICVAILHGSEASNAAVEEPKAHLSQGNSLKVLIEEEVKFLIDTVTEEEKKKHTKRVAETPPSYVINPPFSPIARV